MDLDKAGITLFWVYLPYLFSRVIDGGEPAEFKSLFANWKDKDMTTRISFSRKISTTTVQTKFDAQILHDNPNMVMLTCHRYH